MSGKVFNQKRKSVLGIIVSVILLLQQVLPVMIVRADDTLQNTSFVKSVTLTDWDGNSLGDNISVDSKVRLNCSFEVPEGTEVKGGDKYYINVPEEILLEGTNLDIVTNDGDCIGKCIYGVEQPGKLIIEFNDEVNDATDIKGSILIYTKFDKSKLGTGGDKELVFDLLWTKQVIRVTFEQYEPGESTSEDDKPEQTGEGIITKEGQYDVIKNEITWTIKVDCTSGSLKNTKIIDILDSNQEFVLSVPLSVDGSVLKTSEYTIEGNTLIYQLPDDFTGSTILKVVSKPNASLNESKEEKVSVKNTVDLIVGEEKKNSTEATVDVPTNWIKKTGREVGNRKIEWTVTLYNREDCIIPVTMNDPICDKQKYVEGSLKYKDESGKIISADKNQSITLDNGGVINFSSNSINYKGNLDRKIQVIFQTEVIDEKILCTNSWPIIKNTAVLNFDNDSTRTIDVTAGVCFNSIMIDKTNGVKEYDPSTGELCWKINVNINKFPLINPVITDTINDKQNLVEDSLVIDGNKAKIDGVTASYEDKVLKCKLPSDSQKHVIEYRTKLKDSAKSTKKEKIYNVAYINADNIPGCNDSAYQYVNSDVIEKTGSYNYANNTATWTVVVNRNRMPIRGAVVIDDIPKNQEYIEGSLTTDYTTSTGDELGNVNYEKAADDDESKSGTLSYSFGSSLNEINGMYTITFKTRITDTSFFDGEDNDGSPIKKALENTVVLKGDTIPDDTKATCKLNIEVAPLTKTCDYKYNDDIIKWSILINQNSIDMGDSTIVDTLNKYLKLDTSSIKLYRLKANDNEFPGKDDIDEEVILRDDQVEYNYNNQDGGVCKFRIDNLKEPYLLEYCTYVDSQAVADNVSDIVNNAYFEGSIIKGKSSSIAEGVFFIDGQATGSLTRSGTIEINKKDRATDKPLAGAKFEVYDRFKNVVGTAVTNEEGKAVIKKLGLGMTYTIKEVEAPSGYVVDQDNIKEVTLNNDNKSVSLDWYNRRYRAVRVTKVNENDSTEYLSNAEFNVYEDKDQNGIPDGDKIVTLQELSADPGVYEQELPIGNYVLKEEKAPEGFLRDEKVYSFEIQENSTIVNINSENSEFFTNKVIKGNIELEKVSSDCYSDLLLGAKFAVYSDSNNNGEYDSDDKFVGNMIEGEAGIYKINSVRYGKYFVKEEEAPIGYNVDKKIYIVNIIEDGQTVRVSNCECGEHFINEPVVGYVMVNPTGQCSIQKILKGLKVYIYEDNDGDKVPDDSPVVMLCGKMCNGYKVELPYGKYLVKQECGSILDNHYYSFEISSEGQEIKVITDGKTIIF